MSYWISFLWYVQIATENATRTNSSNGSKFSAENVEILLVNSDVNFGAFRS